ncbi:hypothetical protein [Rhodococcus sp. 14-2470-1a]|uniref:hypothetical protein n=1 Tax=Rhodococcus sp. 14-2470-1a TaxID=2023150 RepID=UPI0015C620AA|nr:hypothetical protein [Rhodococcus sp. 14-2470-1a]
MSAAIVLNVIFAVKVRNVNAGQPLPLLTGKYSTKPTLRVTSFRAVGAAAAMLGAANVVQALWNGPLGYGALIAGAAAAAAVIVPRLAVAAQHNIAINRRAASN